MSICNWNNRQLLYKAASVWLAVSYKFLKVATFCRHDFVRDRPGFTMKYLCSHFCQCYTQLHVEGVFWLILGVFRGYQWLTTDRFDLQKCMPLAIKLVSIRYCKIYEFTWIGRDVDRLGHTSYIYRKSWFSLIIRQRTITWVNCDPCHV